MEKIIEKIKQNKKYTTIADDIVKKEITRYLSSHKKPESKKEKEILIKSVRANLHRSYVSYQTKKKNQVNLLLNKLKSAIHDDNREKINAINQELLSITLSTKERLSDYKDIYTKLFSITGKPKIICDLGSGFNPFSVPLMNLPHIIYHAYDIDEKDINILNKYFRIMKQSIDGLAEIIDLENLNINNLPNSEIVFMFKVIDLIDTKSKRKNKISENIIKDILEKNKTKFITASFATKTLTRKPMNLPRRIGFEKMLERNNLKFKSFSIENEIFYVISKN